jgi:hypothetical protein
MRTEVQSYRSMVRPLIPPAAERNFVFREFYTIYGSALSGRKLRLSDHNQDHSKADKEFYVHGSVHIYIKIPNEMQQ